MTNLILGNGLSHCSKNILAIFEFGQVKSYSVYSDFTSLV